MTWLIIGGLFVFSSLGALWRRWLGAADTGSRSLKLIVGAVLALIVLRVCGVTSADDFDLPAFVRLGCLLLLQLGFCLGHVFDPWWRLIPRYGAVTVAVGLLLWAFGYGWGLAYAPLGLLAPIGYVAARRLGVVCWTCAGEAWLGALIFGGLPLASVLAR